MHALTGVDSDRLAAEKLRGIFIELGYAYQPLADGGVLGFVDVPGHERFIHTMLAGAAGIDFTLLVVAADDGVRARRMFLPTLSATAFAALTEQLLAAGALQRSGLGRKRTIQRTSGYSA